MRNAISADDNPSDLSSGSVALRTVRMYSAPSMQTGRKVSRRPARQTDAARKAGKFAGGECKVLPACRSITALPASAISSDVRRRRFLLLSMEGRMRSLTFELGGAPARRLAREADEGTIRFADQAACRGTSLRAKG